jgi:hypothetical protein
MRGTAIRTARAAMGEGFGLDFTLLDQWESVRYRTNHTRESILRPG